MRSDGRSAVFFYRLGIAGLFLAGFFLLVVFGARTYRSIAAGQEQNGRARALLSYLSVCVKGNDTAGAVAVSETDEGPVLVIADGSSGYAVRIYRDGNRLLEDYGKTDAPLNPAGAQVIGETEVFSVEACSGGLFAVTTDAGRTLFHVKSGEASDE
ncbi:MAG: DUF4860 domain-containing protein [Lachnospiraceae bacterium]|nr:DUF4860 domain-containing protein [Lachnospiraceae bacterium]